ncbi:Mobile element protein [Azospirillum endophyticum]
MTTDGDSIGLCISRDRPGTFDRVLIGNYQRRFPGFDEIIV